MRIWIKSGFVGLIALAVWTDGPTDEAPVPEPLPTMVEARPKVYRSRLEAGSPGVIVLPLADLKDQFWELTPVLGAPNREWRVGDDEYVFPWAEHGDRLIILADSVDDSDPERLVLVRMETGRFAGHTYKIGRGSIAAAK